MGNSRTDIEIKIYKNSECCECVYKFNPPLKIKEHPISSKKVIICRDCFLKLHIEKKGII